MKYIIDIDGINSTRHTYNVWTVFEYEDMSVAKDTRVFSSDSHDEFLAFMKTLTTKDAPCQTNDS